MAIYEYYCRSCNSRFEKRQPMSDVAVATACTCGAKADRLLSMFAIAKSGDADAMFDMSAPAAGGCCGGGGCACSGGAN